MREAAKKLRVELIEVTVSSSDETLLTSQFLAGRAQAIYITYDYVASLFF